MCLYLLKTTEVRIAFENWFVIIIIPLAAIVRFYHWNFYLSVWQATQAHDIYNENEKKLEEMLDGIEKLFGYVRIHELK